MKTSSGRTARPRALVQPVGSSGAMSQVAEPGRGTVITKRFLTKATGSTTVRARWVRRLAVGGLLLMGTAGGIATLRAQAPAGQAGMPDRTYMNKSAIQ